MKLFSTRPLLLKSSFVAAALLGSVGACGHGDVADDSRKRNSPPAGGFGCDEVLVDHSGRGFIPEILESDPFFQAVYQDAAGGCPITFPEIMEKLAETDGDCKQQEMKTRIVSEENALFGNDEFTTFRAVASRECGDRPQFGMLFSMFGFHGGDDGPLSVGGKEYPGGLEVISFDPQNGVFNYFKAFDSDFDGVDEMNWSGNSIDFIQQGPERPGLTEVRGCATCHTGGGLIFKEHRSPWVHWDGNGAAAELVSNRELLGRQEKGANMQFQVVEPGNRKWNETRLAVLKDEGAVADLLEPLFCPVEVNLATGTKGTVPGRLLLDRAAGSSVGLRFNGGEYDRIATAIGQRVPETEAEDLVQPFAFIERAFADEDYTAQLIRGVPSQDIAPVVSAEFAAAVRMVDLTRPVYSADRCGLLEFAPDLAPEERTAENILSGFLANLEAENPGKRSAAGQLLQYLQVIRDDVDSFDDRKRETVAKFTDACEKRAGQAPVSLPDDEDGARQVMIDVMKLRSLGLKIATGNAPRSAARGLKHIEEIAVFEFPLSTTTDDIAVSTSAKPDDLTRVHPKARLSPTTCKLVKSFVPAPLLEAE